MSLTSDGKRYLDLARAKCAGDVSNVLRSVAPGSLIDSALSGQAFADALRDSTAVPVGGYPVRIDHGLLDPVVPYALTMSLVRAMQAGRRRRNRCQRVLVGTVYRCRPPHPP